MNEEVYREIWYLEGTEEQLEKIENFIQEMDVNYSIKAQVRPNQEYSISLKEKDK